jgi:hypothetical protein
LFTNCKGGGWRRKKEKICSPVNKDFELRERERERERGTHAHCSLGNIIYPIDCHNIQDWSQFVEEETFVGERESFSL